MSKSKLTPGEARELIIAKLSHNFGVTPADATDEHYYKAIALVLGDIMREQQKKFTEAALKEKSKTVYYLCMEFLLGRSLKNNIYNLNLENMPKDEALLDIIKRTLEAITFFRIHIFF